MISNFKFRVEIVYKRERGIGISFLVSFLFYFSFFFLSFAKGLISRVARNVSRANGLIKNSVSVEDNWHRQRPQIIPSFEFPAGEHTLIS